MVRLFVCWGGEFLRDRVDRKDLREDAISVDCNFACSLCVLGLLSQTKDYYVGFMGSCELFLLIRTISYSINTQPTFPDRICYQKDVKYNTRQKCHRWIVFNVYHIRRVFWFAIVSCQKL